MILNSAIEDYDEATLDADSLPVGELFPNRTPLCDPQGLSAATQADALAQWDGYHGNQIQLAGTPIQGLSGEYWSDTSHHIVDVRCLSDDGEGERTYLLALSKLVKHKSSNKHATIAWEDTTKVRTENIQKLLRNLFVAFSEVSA